MQGFVWGPVHQSLTQKSELTLRNDSFKMPWLWGCWMLGMSKWITPCNTWHQLFCLPGYCFWHKVMHTAHDPRWHRVMSWDMQTFWNSVGRKGEQRCLSGTSLQWQVVLSTELCSLMGQFHRNGLSFSSSKNFFFSLRWFSGRCDICLQNIIIKHNTLKGICISCQFIFSVLTHWFTFYSMSYHV